MIYDRWGEVIFKSNDINQGWDGRYKGEMSQIGTYIWIVYCKDFINNEKVLSGKVTIIK